MAGVIAPGTCKLSLILNMMLSVLNEYNFVRMKVESISIKNDATQQYEWLLHDLNGAHLRFSIVVVCFLCTVHKNYNHYQNVLSDIYRTHLGILRRLT